MNVRDTPSYRTGGRLRYPVREEDDDDTDNGDSEEYSTFEDRYVRHRFIRKVYTILTIQLLFTFGFILLCSLV